MWSQLQELEFLMNPERLRKAFRITEKKNSKGESIWYFMPYELMGVSGFYGTATSEGAALNELKRVLESIRDRNNIQWC